LDPFATHPIHSGDMTVTASAALVLGSSSHSAIDYQIPSSEGLGFCSEAFQDFATK
jgi:hypothetical protein